MAKTGNVTRAVYRHATNEGLSNQVNSLVMFFCKDYNITPR